MASSNKKDQVSRPLQFSLPDVREQSEVVWRDQIAGKAIRLALLSIVVGVGLLAWQYRNLPPEVPLFYSLPWGEAQLATPLGLLLLPGVSLAVVVINSFLGGGVFAENRLLARMLLVAAAMVSFLTTYALVRILILILV